VRMVCSVLPVIVVSRGHSGTNGPWLRDVKENATRAVVDNF